MPIRLSALILAALFAAGQAPAQNIETRRITFAPGRSGTVLEGSLTGDQIVDYVLEASAGQRMVANMTTTSPDAYFNVQPSGSETAIFVGSTSGLHFDGALPSGGDWVVRVYLMRNAARRGETAGYKVDVSIEGDGKAAGETAAAAPATPPPDYADGNAGGPDWWQVTGASALNIRSGPGTDNAAIGKAAGGQRLRNLGCQGTGSDRWCQVEVEDGAYRGWVAGSYLSEAGAPSERAPAMESEAMGPDFWEVAGVPANDVLNLRKGPAASFDVVAKAANGDLLRNLGCEGTGSARWCHVRSPGGSIDGWASGAFLREGAGPENAWPTVTIPADGAVRPELRIRPTGQVEAAWSSGCTVLYDTAGKRISAGASCTEAQLAASDQWAAKSN